jgi:hypothetical protein
MVPQICVSSATHRQRHHRHHHHQRQPHPHLHQPPPSDSLLKINKDIEKQTWGNMNVISEQKYSELEELLGLTRCSFEDMSPKVYPTYEIIRKKSVLSQNQSFQFVNALIQLFAKIGMIKYHLYSWKLE